MARIAFVLMRFGPSLKGFFANLSELSFKGPGFEAALKRKQAEATSELVASVARPTADTAPLSAARNAKEAAEVVAEAVSQRIIRRASEATVFWVDDRPDNNIFERQSLAALGVSFVLARSTDEAIEKIGTKKFDVVISDMARPDDRRAEYSLLEKLRKIGDKAPFIIYSASNALDKKDEARNNGAFGLANNASELFLYVLSTLD